MSYILFSFPLLFIMQWSTQYRFHKLSPWRGLLSLPFCHPHIILDTTLKQILIAELSYCIPIYKILLAKLYSFTIFKFVIYIIIRPSESFTTTCACLSVHIFLTFETSSIRGMFCFWFGLVFWGGGSYLFACFSKIRFLCGCLGTPSVSKAGLDVGDLPASASPSTGIKGLGHHAQL